jgi:hypothetical protein
MSLGEVDSFLPQLLRMQDAQRFGVKGTLRHLNNLERKEEELQDRRETDMLRDISGEAYGTLQIAQGERTYGGGLRDA